jgi:hypothetical protein
MRRVLWAFVVVLCFTITPSHAQTALTLESGRMFSVSAGSFVLGSSATLDYSKGPLTLSSVLYTSRDGIFEKDLTAALSKERGKWAFGTYAGVYWYTGIGRDFSWSVSVRRVLR